MYLPNYLHLPLFVYLSPVFPFLLVGYPQLSSVVSAHPVSLPYCPPAVQSQLFGNFVLALDFVKEKPLDLLLRLGPLCKSWQTWVEWRLSTSVMRNAFLSNLAELGMTPTPFQKSQFQNQVAIMKQRIWSQWWDVTNYSCRRFCLIQISYLNTASQIWCFLLMIHITHARQYLVHMHAFQKAVTFSWKSDAGHLQLWMWVFNHIRSDFFRIILELENVAYSVNMA